ncbi:MAG: hypothetical protein AB1638_13430 [Nitrospirota bacterium]
MKKMIKELKQKAIEIVKSRDDLEIPNKEQLIIIPHLPPNLTKHGRADLTIMRRAPEGLHIAFVEYDQQESSVLSNVGKYALYLHGAPNFYRACLFHILGGYHTRENFRLHREEAKVIGNLLTNLNSGFGYSQVCLFELGVPDFKKGEKSADFNKRDAEKTEIILKGILIPWLDMGRKANGG